MSIVDTDGIPAGNGGRFLHKSERDALFSGFFVLNTFRRIPTQLPRCGAAVLSGVVSGRAGVRRSRLWTCHPAVLIDGMTYS